MYRETSPGESAIEQLLAANSVFPWQFWEPEHGTTQLSGERALMWAVFADGIESYRRSAGATSIHARLEFLEAEQWIRRTDWDWPFSFVNLCEAFRFDPAAVRRMLGCSQQTHVRRKFRRQRFRQVARRAA